MSAKTKAEAEVIKMVTVTVTFDNEREFEQFIHMNGLHPKEMNKLLPKDLRFTKEEMNDYTWMEAIQEGVTELVNQDIIDN